MADLPHEITDALAAFETNLNGIETALAPFFADPDLHSKLLPLEAAKANLVSAYAANTLFYMYLKTQGINPQDHPVKKELERIRTYIQKVRSLTEAEKERGNARTMTVDAAAASRFVKAALGAQGTSASNADGDAMETDDKSDDDSDDNSMDVDEESQNTKAPAAQPKPSSKSVTAGKTPRRTESGFGGANPSPSRKNTSK